jgi:drug/metabolite transporter (DMT)-like permease
VKYEHLPSSQNNPSLKGDFYLFGATVIWALNISAVYLAMRTFHGFEVTFLTMRFAIATLALLPLALPRVRNFAELRRYHLPVILISISLFVAYWSQTISLRHALPGRVAFLINLSVIFVPIAAFVALKRRIKLHEWIAAITGTIGLGLLTCPTAGPLRPGDGFALLSAVALTADLLLIAKYSRILDPVVLTFYTAVVLCVCYGVISLIFEVPVGIPKIDWRVALGLVSTGIFATAVAFVLQTLGQRTTNEVHTAIILNLESVIAAGASAVFFGERLHSVEVFGGALIVTSAFLIELGSKIGWLRVER